MHTGSSRVQYQRELYMPKKRALAAKKRQRKTPAKSRFVLRGTVPDSTDLAPSESLQTSEFPAQFQPDLFLRNFAGGDMKREYLAGKPIFAQGDPADSVFYVRSGKVKLTVVSKRGKEAVVAILPESSFFGEGCLAGQPLRMSTARAMQKCEIVRVEKLAMLERINREPEFAARFLAYLLSRNIRMEADLVDHLFNSSEKRLARLLLLLANFGHESKPLPVIAKMSQETLAEMIGTTRSRVSYFLNRFRDLGFIEYDSGGMHVHSSLVSVVLHD